MLGKLLKYEWKSTRRIFPLIYAAILVIALLGGLSMRGIETGGNEVSSILFLVIYAILIMALLVVTVVVIIARFYKNMMSQEGYLSHVLPVKTWEHIASKTIMAFIWFVLAFAVIVVSIFLMVTATGDLRIIWDEINLQELLDALAIYRPQFVLIIAGMLVQSVRMILQFYASMAIGGSANKHKIFFSFLAFIVICIAVSIVNTFMSVGTVGSIMNMVISYGSPDFSMTMIFVRQLISDAIISAVFFILTNYFLKKLEFP